MFSCSRFYVRDGALVGDFRDSLQPMIWRMELSRVHAVGFRVQQNGSNWDLGMEGSAGTFTPITSYSTQAAANKALSGIGRGLRRQGWMRRSVHFVLFVLLALFVMGLFYQFGSGMFGGSSAGRVQMPAATQIPLGQPMSADQALRAPPR